MRPFHPVVYQTGRPSCKTTVVDCENDSRYTFSGKINFGPTEICILFSCHSILKQQYHISQMFEPKMAEGVLRSEFILWQVSNYSGCRVITDFFDSFFIIIFFFPCMHVCMSVYTCACCSAQAFC